MFLDPEADGGRRIVELEGQDMDEDEDEEMEEMPGEDDDDEAGQDVDEEAEEEEEEVLHVYSSDTGKTHELTRKLKMCQHQS